VEKEIIKNKGSEENIYRLLIDAVPMKMFFKDRNSAYVWCNEGYAEDLKIATKDIAGKTDYDFYPKDLAEKYIADDQILMQQGQPLQLEEGYLREGQKAFVQTFKAPVRDAGGEVIGLLGVFTDITDKKLAQIRMEESEVKYRTLIETIDAGYVIVDQDGTVIDANPEYVRLTGESRLEEILGRKVTEWTVDHQREEHRGIIKKCFGEGRIRNIMLDFIDGKGNVTPVELNATTIEIDGKLRAIKMVRDIIERKAAEKVLQERADELERLNQNLRAEMDERKRAENIISRQSREILEIATPVLQVWEGIVAAPLIGTLDSLRTQQLMEQLLQRIVETNSLVALIDVTGVPAIDTQTAQHLIEAISAVRLLGAQVVLTGIRPAIAQTLVHLGIDLSNVNTCSSLSTGLGYALDLLKMQVVHKA
jgi:PAS domain S-box-containing protein